jgi:hypothetical protein
MDMIYIKHPIEKYNQSQKALLEKCSESERLQQALLFNHGNAAYRYYQIEPTQEEFKDWLVGLPENIRKKFEEDGFESSKNVLPFLRFAQELRDVGMDEYLKKLLTPEDYIAIKKLADQPDE